MFLKKSCFFTLFLLLALASMSFATTFTCTGTNGVVVNGTSTSVSVSVPTNYTLTATNLNSYVFKYGSQTIFTSSYTNAMIIVPEGGPAGDPGAGGEVQYLGITTYTFPDGGNVKSYCNYTTETELNPESYQELVSKLSTDQYNNFVNLTSGVDSIGDIQPLGWWKCFKIRLRIGLWWLLRNGNKWLDAQIDYYQNCM